jgi:hypothetical protein
MTLHLSAGLITMSSAGLICSKQIRKELKTKHKKERDDIDESTFEFLNF